ncbi:hypothetical protein LTR62_006240 [Meristemomyces frigidus]|uniref:PLC-like phosphodiesterase n=1 Tax=Meristemomyces frigidus TaxID=1508187 RepID=A0AAN7YQ11_9PEZI|nr:hypothetical protein LTR62_006240 [Meristemomyces frigidus]
MLPPALWLLCLATIRVRSQTTNDALSFTNLVSTRSSLPTSDFTASQYTYISATGQSTLNVSSSTVTASNATATSSTNSHATSSSTSSAPTFAIGGSRTAGTATATSSGATPTNTLPCNNYPEFCNRKYSNITEVCAHNSAFSIKNNAASNQELSITTQLDDVQGETHHVNNTIYNCHTSCSLLNAGTWQSSLETLVAWLQQNPYEVVTWLIVNSDYVSVGNYTAAIENSGIKPYLYIPQYSPQHRDQWPTLGEMILSGKRVVMFMDYYADPASVPYILDEFTHIWETPFSPTNQSFPCSQQRPPGLNQTAARDEYMYLANHNLNVPVDIGAIMGGGSTQSILIPNFAELNVTNGEYDQFGEAGAASLNCTAEWGRPPNFILVDYYNIGSPGPGSVFEVAAKANGVTYNRRCCGVSATSDAGPRVGVTGALVALVGAVTFAAVVVGW